MSVNYAAIVQEDHQSLQLLASNHYSLQIAKAVSTPGGKATFNLVYKSSSPNANLSIPWTSSYALNWTTEVAAPGTPVTCSGSWQSCNLGQSYDIDASGEWVASRDSSSSDAQSLNIGVNNYQQLVHVIIGVRDPAGRWTPIWIGTDALLKGAHGEYTPTQKIKLWWDQGQQQSNMMGGQGTQPQEYDMSSTPTCYFSYSAMQGSWLVPSPTPILQ